MTKQKYLHGLAYEYLSDEEVLQGFAEHYLVCGVGVQEMCKDMCKDMCLTVSAKAAQETGERMMRLFRILAGKEEYERDRGQAD